MPPADASQVVAAGSGDPFLRPVASAAPLASAVKDPFSAPSADPFANLDLGVSPSSKAPIDPFGQTQAPNRGARDSSDDPFAIGPAGSPAGSPASGSGNSGHWSLQTASGAETLELGTLRERVRSGLVSAADQAGPVGAPLKSIKDWPLLAVALPQNHAKKIKPVGGRRVAAGESLLPRPLLAAVLVTVVLGGSGFAAWKLKPQWFESKSEFGVNPLRRAEVLWRRQFPDPEGTAEEYLVAGRKQMRLDTASGCRKADDELRQALLRNVGHLGALAAWAENLSHLPTVRSDLEGSTLAQEALEYGLKREPENVDLLRAQASLKLALGAVDEAQRILLKIKVLAPNDIDALVILARSNLERSPADALAIIQRDVRSQNTDLKEAYVIEGAAQRRLGAYKEAREMLEARLASDPGNVPALKERAKLELDLGHADAAISDLGKLVATEDQDVEAHLLRAKINYQIKGGPDGLKAADQQLSEVLARHAGAAGELLLEVLSHAAYVKTQLGELDAAIAIGERARALDAGHPSALFVLGRAYAQKGNLENAKKTLEQAVRATEQREEFYEPLVRAELAAVQARAGDEANAIRNLQKVIEYDVRNMRAHFSLASIYIKNGKISQAMAIMQLASHGDPAWYLELLSLTDFPLAAEDVIAFADVFSKAQAAEDDESSISQKYAAEGMIRYIGGQRKNAEKLFSASLEKDRNNLAAILYLSVLNMEEAQYAEPLLRLKAAVEMTAASRPIMRLYLARAELFSGDAVGARAHLAELVENEPSLVQARYSLAMALREQKLEAEATSELRTVVQQDPDFLPAKQALAGGS